MSWRSRKITEAVGALGLQDQRNYTLIYYLIIHHLRKRETEYTEWHSNTHLKHNVHIHTHTHFQWWPLLLATRLLEDIKKMLYARLQIKHWQISQGGLKQLRRTTLGLWTHVPLTQKCVAAEIQNLQQKGGKIIQGSGELGEQEGESGRENKCSSCSSTGAGAQWRGHYHSNTEKSWGKDRC